VPTLLGKLKRAVAQVFAPGSITTIPVAWLHGRTRPSSVNNPCSFIKPGRTTDDFDNYVAKKFKNHLSRHCERMVFTQSSRFKNPTSE